MFEGLLGFPDELGLDGDSLFVLIRQLLLQVGELFLNKVFHHRLVSNLSL